MSRTELLREGTMECRNAREILSDYLEGGLDPPARQAIAAHLGACTDCAAEARGLSTMLHFFHEKLPRREPVIDLWVEMQPKVAEIIAEQRLGLLARLQLQARRFLNNVAVGMIWYTNRMAINTAATMQRFLLNDPYRIAEDEVA
jgi:anti-sigma factor RsiW